jgi:hypothetical protein
VRILFLDFDGVIRLCPDFNTRGEIPDPVFSIPKMEILADICKTTGTSVVISSEHRKHLTKMGVIDKLTGNLARHLHRNWATPVIPGVNRWAEIFSWLDAYGDQIEHFAILDDYAPHFRDAPPGIRSKLVLCNNRHGFVPELKDSLIEKLTGLSIAQKAECDTSLL